MSIPEPTPLRPDCVLWTGAFDKKTGYGKVRWQGRTASAHRVAFERAIGPIPSGLYVCHHCDVRLCVNPAHLFLGTARDNSRDMSAKGRGRKPECGHDLTVHGVRRYGTTRLRCRLCLRAMQRASDKRRYWAQKVAMR
jgi:hypothetical protein